MIADIGLVLALVLTGILAGNELGTLAVIHPSLDRLPHEVGRPAAQAIVAYYGRVMPALMPITVIVLFVTAAMLDGTAALLTLIAALALVAMLIVTFAGNVPLNVRQLRATADTPVDQWRAWRRRWWWLHVARVICDLAALTLVAVGAVTG